MTSIRQAVTYFIIGALCAGAASWLYLEDVGSQPHLWFVLLWPTVVLWVIGFWYAVDSHVAIRMIGKDMTTGRITLGTHLLLLPYFVVAHGWWLIRHKLILRWFEGPYDLVAEDVYVGRWPLHYPSEFPVSAKGVVDLTAEWTTRACVTDGRKYLCLPAMDCDMPDKMLLLNKARLVADTWEGGIYVHCANGHGRSSCFAALVLVFRGLAADWKQAFSLMKAHRKYISVQAPQIAMMNELQAMIEPELRARRNM